MPFEIRFVRASDADAVVAFVATVLAEFGLEFGNGSATDAQLRGLPESYASGAFWVADDGDAIVGTCGVFPVGSGTFELRKMYVAPSTRGSGLGKRLLEMAIAWVRANGGRRVVLDTVEQMTRAIGFYEANGFVRADAEIRGARCTRGYALDLPRE